MRKYGELNQNQANNTWMREAIINADMTEGNHTLERNGPNRKNLKVLHEDGSFADLPDNDIPGAGALSGCITK
ncbi:hypothetical protein [Mucilaginibacter ginsenosidivorax]|uniref:Uncharacterized protein n=1 Tax=Mucilaginibacter ginsenosidivorax TaxID=862126 RepID=A0A5B8WE49_9SPHI|nr:hypothetical protein [Mucilaginibacter ginsenosidivorax]QEC80158.1 hypothetical protein FSB76_30935 [Mucilaginibacter ginsenosidivorax]